MKTLALLILSASLAFGQTPLVNGKGDGITDAAAFRAAIDTPSTAEAIPAAADISDAGATGISLLQSATPAAARAALNIGSDAVTVVVADAAARELLATYTSLGVTPTRGLRVTQTDEDAGGYPTVCYVFVGADVTLDASWHPIPLVNPATGEFVVDLRLADFTGIVPPANSIGQVGGEFRLGDGTTTEGNPVGVPGAGINSVVVTVGDDPAVNGNNLLAAYTKAKTLTPNGAALSATNRAVVLLPPGKYSFTPGSGVTAIAINTEFIDFVGLSNVREHVLITSNGSTIVQTANDIEIANLSLESTHTNGQFAYDPSSAASTTNTKLTNIRFYGSNPMTTSQFSTIYDGLYRDCKGTGEMFPGGANGTFIDCEGGGASFGSYMLIGSSGTFIRCTAGAGSFDQSSFAGLLLNCNMTAGSFPARASGGQAVFCFEEATGTIVTDAAPAP